MRENVKQWLIYLGIWMAALAATWGWSRLQMSNLSYMQFVTQRNQENIARQQQLEANELQLRKQRKECCDCSLIPKEVGGEESGLEEEGGKNP